MTPEASKTLKTLIRFDSQSKPITMVDLINKLKMFQYGKVESILKYLSLKGYIQYTPPKTLTEQLRFQITEVAYEHFIANRQSWIRFWIPTIVSILALLRPEIIKIANYLLKFITKP